MPRLRISALSWMWVLGKRPPFTKKIFTPSSTTASPTIANVNSNVAIICVFCAKRPANLVILCDSKHDNLHYFCSN